MLVGAVLYAKEMLKLVHFYESIGFTVSDSDDSATTLVATNCELFVIQAPSSIADALTLVEPAEMRASTPIKLVFQVSSIVDSAKVINESGGRVDRGQARWELGNFFVQDAVDPEGNIIQLREMKL